MLNKKAAMPSTVVFVFLTLVLVIATLSIFQISVIGFSTNFQDVGVLEEIYVRENILEYYLFTIGNDLLAEENLNEDSFKENFLLINSESNDDLERLQGKIAREEFLLVGNHFELIGNQSFVSEREGIYVYYISKLEVDFLDLESRYEPSSPGDYNVPDLTGDQLA